MANWSVIKSDAVNEEFLGLAGEFDGWLAAMDFAMSEEWAVYERGERSNGHKILFSVELASRGIVDAESYRAFRSWQRAQPVVNVYD